MKRIPALVFATTICLAGAAGRGAIVAANDEPALPPAALQAIDVAGLEAHIRFLSDDLLEGRAPATRGGDLAARYIAAMFRTLGLEPGAADGTYFQQVPILETEVQGAVTLTATGSGGELRLTSPDDVVAFSGTDRAQVTVDAPVVFVGYGITAPEFNWNDYAGVDVKGKIVLAMVNDPPATEAEPNLFGGRALTYYGRWTYKYEEAARQGAAGAILIHTTESASYPFSVVQSSWSGTQYSIPPAAGTPLLELKAWVTEDAARKLASLGGHDLDALRKAAQSRGAKAVDLGVRVATSFAQKVTRKSSPNVIGKLAGSAGSGESIIFSAHYDHIGMRPGGQGDTIYNGARDNASGVAGLLEIAEALAAAPRPRRDVYFVATTAEESGLLGSEYLAANPPMPIDKVAANINMDSLNVYGPSSEVVLLGSERSTLGAIADRLAAASGRKIGADPTPERGAFFRSDHFPLAKVGVPALSITLGAPSAFTGPGAEKARELAKTYNETHYHQPSDEFSPDWNLEGALQDVQLLAQIGWVVASSTEMPAYHPTEQFAAPRKK
ncbi:MAG TPA: M20/M25/M40 family metallo-hydrolase [Vicinamibacterales bacterium]